MQPNEPPKKKPRGLAAMSPERRREIASMGGKATTGSFKYHKERASRAGKIGGRISRPRKVNRGEA